LTNCRHYAHKVGISEFNYNPLVGDFCYKYSRSARENFFENKVCSFLFLLSVPYILKREEHNIETNYIIKDFIQSARGNLNGRCLRLLANI
jgi:hypothetical protein